MDAPVEIRRMRAGDAEAVTRLSTELGYPDSVTAIGDRIAYANNNPEHAAFVAVRDGEVLGWIHIFIMHLLETPDFAEIGGLVVGRAARRTGVGAALVEAAATWSHGMGVTALHVRSNVIRETAHAFYRALGFRDLKSQLMLVRKLRPDP
ncbi:GNAT family N-acetyltransferase [Uliginosibacterium sp. sgz301328]|uniref:GNAT family N-acetyltransferase n=1 Tax=Uliginosibacterium sp. sgz301328 TaxID=3243764 RepID=UPI00359D499D